MAKNRKNQAAAIRFGPALKASFFILLIGGSAVGYVWQKSQIDQLGLQIAGREKQISQFKVNNQKLKTLVADLQSPVSLDQRVKFLNLGLAPASPTQVVRLNDAAPAVENNSVPRVFAQRPAAELTP
jgi:cell division protein FtsB